MEISTVPIQHLLAMLKQAEAAGHSSQELLEHSGINPDLLDVAKARVPMSNYVAFSHRVMWLMEDESCGLLPTPVKPGSFVLLAQSCISCETLDEVMQRIIQFTQLVVDDIQSSLYRHEDSATYRIQQKAGNEPINQHFIIILLALAHRLGCWSIRRYIPLDAILVVGNLCTYAEKKRRRSRKCCRIQ